MAQRLRLTDIAVPSSALAERGRVLGIIWSSEPVAETTGKCTQKKKKKERRKKSVTSQIALQYCKLQDMATGRNDGF